MHIIEKVLREDFWVEFLSKKEQKIFCLRIGENRSSTHS